MSWPRQCLGFFLSHSYSYPLYLLSSILTWYRWSYTSPRHIHMTVLRWRVAPLLVFRFVFLNLCLHRLPCPRPFAASETDRRRDRSCRRAAKSDCRSHSAAATRIYLIGGYGTVSIAGGALSNDRSRRSLSDNRERTRRSRRKRLENVRLRSLAIDSGKLLQVGTAISWLQRCFLLDKPPDKK